MLDVRGSGFEGTDYLGLEPDLTPEQRLVRDNVRAFVDREFMPLIAEANEAGRFPSELVPRLASLGVFGANLKGYGCAGMDHTSYGLLMQELERGDAGLRSCASVQSSLVMYPIWAFGSEAQKNQWLPAMARGDALGCFGLTEPDSGSDPASMRTRARRDGGDWVLDGAKMWITNGSASKVALVWAKTGDDAASVRGFLVPAGTPGFTARDLHGKLSMRASITSELALDGVRVPHDAMLPGDGARGLKGALACLTQARFGIAWGVTGAAIDCYERARAYALERVQFSRPVASFQLQQQKLTDMLTLCVTSQLVNFQLGRVKDRGELRPEQVSFAKRHNVAAARDVARLAREMMGGNGIMGEYHVMRHLTNIETVYTYEGTHDIHTLVIGRDVTGLNAFA